MVDKPDQELCASAEWFSFQQELLKMELNDKRAKAAQARNRRLYREENPDD